MEFAAASSLDEAYYAFLENVLEIGLKTLLAVYIPVLTLVFWVVHWNTPAEMQSFRLTMTNGSFWMLTGIVYWSFLFRPMPLAPLPIATAKGNSSQNSFVSLALTMLPLSRSGIDYYWKRGPPLGVH